MFCPRPCAAAASLSPFASAAATIESALFAPSGDDWMTFAAAAYCICAIFAAIKADTNATESIRCSEAGPSREWVNKWLAVTSTRRNGLFAAIVVEAAFGFAAEPASLDIFHEKRTGAVFRIGQAFVQYLHYGEYRIEADKIGELQGAHRMMCAEAHGLIDRLDIADAFVKHVDRLVDHRQQNAVHDEGGEILRNGGNLAEACDIFLGGFEGLIAGGDAADEFDKLH